jgi:hypothetical protein
MLEKQSMGRIRLTTKGNGTISLSLRIDQLKLLVPSSRLLATSVRDLCERSLRVLGSELKLVPDFTVAT